MNTFKKSVLLGLIFIFSSCYKEPSNQSLNSTFFNNEKVFSQLVEYISKQPLLYLTIEKCNVEDCFAKFPKDIREFFIKEKFVKIEFTSQKGRWGIELTVYKSRIFNSGTQKGFYYTNVPELTGGNYTSMPLKNGWFLFDIAL